MCLSTKGKQIRNAGPLCYEISGTVFRIRSIEMETVPDPWICTLDYGSGSCSFRLWLPTK
jgi:hypothetical protein